jgi:transposase
VMNENSKDRRCVFHSDVRDHIDSQKNDHRASYPRYRALQRRSRLRICFCEIFGDSDPEAISVYVRSKAPDAVASDSRLDRRPRDCGPSLSDWPAGDLHRRAPRQGVLRMQINKSDRNDAIGIARIMQTCWFKEVHVKDIDSHSVRALLASRALLVKIKRDLENHVRDLLKNLGLVIGRATFNVFAVRAEELIEGRPELIAAIRPLLEARKAVERQVGELDRKVMKLVRHDAQVRRFMTAPGVGPITALAFKATMDDPARFA